MYNTPQIRNGGFGALQVEAYTNRPLSIARRHLAASQLRMRDIEPDELTSSDWVRFLVMEERERDRWMAEFKRQRRNSDDSTSSAELDQMTAYDKAEEARQEAAEARTAAMFATSSRAAPPAATPAVTQWVRQFDEQNGRSDDGAPEEALFTRARPMHARRAVTEGIIEAPPTYDAAVRARTPPPAYEPRDGEERPMSPAYEREAPIYP